MSCWTGRHLLIAGATSGIGLALAEALAARGARLTLFSRRAAGLATHPALAGLDAGRLRLVTGDITDPAAVGRLTDELGTAGDLDGVIVAAGVSRPDLVEAIDVGRAIDTLRVNLEGPIRLIYGLLPALRDRPGSLIVGFTSMAGDRGMPRAHIYSAAKAGLDRFLESLRIDLWDRRVQVVTVVPGYVDTPMARQNQFPMPGIWPPERAARHILAGIERGRLVIRFPWTHALGMRLLTALPDRLYCWLMNRHRTEVRVRPQPGDRFQW